MPFKTSFFFVAFSMGLVLGSCVEAQIADRVFMNAKIYTANDGQAFAEAIAVKDGQFIFVGSNAEVGSFIGSTTIVEDLNGRLMLPGIHDVHMHPLEAGSPIGGGCLLDSHESEPEDLGVELDFCSLEPNENGWIMASGHSIFTLWEAERNPSEILDDYYPDVPMVVMEETSHSVWVNSIALEQLGITADTPDPVGGHIYKDEFGDPNGILIDNAGDLALTSALIPNGTIDDLNYAGLIEYSLPLLAENGITSICEGRTYWKRNYIEIWQDIKAANLLTVRVNLAPWIYPDDDDDTQIPMIQTLYDEGDDLLKVSQIKLYADGIPINATAALHQPYVDNLGLPFDTGLNYINEARMANLITQLEQTGYDFHIHAIGDRGITEALNAIATARNNNGEIGARHRITHLEIVRSSDIPRFPLLNVTADMQVAGDFTNPVNWQENDFLLGPERTDSIVPVKAFYEAGARITLSSDWDVSSINPFVGLGNALTRSPQELATVEDAVKAYTINGAYVMRQEEITGSIETGKLADFICVDRDIFSIPLANIKDTKVLCTYLDGEEIYRSPDFPTALVEPGELKTIRTFPNPGDSLINIDLTGLQVRELNIYSVSGQRLHQISSLSSNLLQIDIVNYADGTYLIEAILNEGKTARASFQKY